MPFRPSNRYSSSLKEYGLAVLAPVVTLVLQFFIQDWIPHTLFIGHFFPIMVVAWFGGLGPGLVSTGLVLLSVNYCFMEPQFSFKLSGTAAFQSGLFLLNGAAIVWVSSRYASRKRFHEEREDAAEKLRQSQNQLRIVADSLPVLISYIGRDLKYGFVNKTYESWFGRPRAEMVGKTMAEVLGDSAIPSLKPHIDEALSGRTAMFETETHYKYGGTRNIRAAYVPDIDQKGKVLGFAVLVSDISEEKRAAESLRKSEEEFRAMFELAVSGKVQAEANTRRFTRVNRKFCEITGYSEQELLQLTAHDLTHPDDRTADADAIAPTLRGEANGWSSEKRYIRKDGKVIWVLVMGTIVSHPGRPIMIATVHDITERKDAEQALLAAVRARDEFLSVASHELKTPLTALSLQNQLRLRRLARGQLADFSTDKLPKLFEADTRQVEQLTRLVDDMLDISRIRSGRLSIRRESVDLEELVEQLVQRFLPQLDAAGCEVNFERNGPVSGSWDRFRIEQVITNLITNAMKYGAGKPVHIRVSSVRNSAVLSVRDFGHGIAKTDQQRIFERFERAVSGAAPSGLGLGLYISREIITAHQGEIEVESDVGRGSTFTVKLPLNSLN